MINKPPPFKGLKKKRIPINNPYKGKGFLVRGLDYRADLESSNKFKGQCSAPTEFTAADQTTMSG